MASRIPKSKRNNNRRPPPGTNAGRPAGTPSNVPVARSTATQRPANSGTGMDTPVTSTKPAQALSMLLEHTEQVTVPQLPSLLPQSQQAQTTTVKSVADLMLQYIVSTGPILGRQFGTPAGAHQGAGIHILPLYIDELERDFGTDMYLRMLNDSTVKSADATLRDAILDKPLQVMSACDEKTEKDQKRLAFAQEVADFIRANLDNVQGGFGIVSREMLEAMALGYKLAEQVYEVKEIVPGNGPQTCLQSLHPKPQEAVSMAVDQYNDLVGYLPRLAGSGLFGTFMFGDLGVRTQEGMVSNPDQELDIPGLVPPEKMLRFTWASRNDDPRGTSHLRAAYVPWRLKIGLYPAYETYLARFAQPSAKMELEGADMPPMADANGLLLNTPLAIQQALLLSLRNFQAGGALIAPVGKVDLMQDTSDGDPYLRAFELVDSQIRASILAANLATEGGKYGTQALGEVHQDTQGLIIQYGKMAWAECVRSQLARPLVLYNYGEEGLWALPKLSYGETEQQDFATLSGGYASLAGVEMVFPHQLNDIFETLHMPQLPQEVITMLIEKWEAEVAAAVTLAQNPMGMPGEDPNAPTDADGNPIDPNSPQAQGAKAQDPNAPDTAYWSA